MSDHDHRTCNLCAMMRHPAQSRQTAELAKHLSKYPFPKQPKEKS